MLLLALLLTHPHVWTRWQSPAICCTCERAQSRHQPVLILPILSGVHVWKRFYKRCVCACSGWSEPAGPVQQPAAEEPSQQVELRQLPLLGQLRRRDVRRVCVRTCVRLHGERPTHRTTSALSDWRDHTGTNHFTTQAKTHTHKHYDHPSPPHIPFCSVYPPFQIYGCCM